MLGEPSLPEGAPLVRLLRRLSMGSPTKEDAVMEPSETVALAEDPEGDVFDEQLMDLLRACTKSG